MRISSRGPSGPWSLLLLGLAAFSPATASAGWHARQIMRGDAAGPSAGAKSDLYYQDGQLRIDEGTRSTVILRLRTGRLVMIDHERKAYVDDSVEERMAQRDQMIAALKARRAELPPEAQKRFDEEMARLEKGPEAPAPKPTGKKDKVAKWTCDIVTLSGENMEGEICLAKDLGVKLDDFAKDARTFGQMMDKLGAKAPGVNLLLDVAERGFPVRMKQKLRVSKDGPWIEGTSEMELFEAMDVPASKFAIPEGYSKHTMPARGAMPPPTPPPSR